MHADIDKAWSLIKAGLVRGLSIGFKELDSEAIPDSWGRKFTKWEWLETSAVTIAANREATITTIKTFDDNPEIPLPTEAASAGTALRVVKLNRPGPPWGITAVRDQEDQPERLKNPPGVINMQSYTQPGRCLRGAAGGQRCRHERAAERF